MDFINHKDEICHFRRALEDVPYCWKKIVQLHQKIDYKRHEMSGLARRGVDLTPEQEKSTLAMPRYRKTPTLSEQIDELIELLTEQEEYQKRILACEVIEKLPQREKDLLIEAYVFHTDRWTLAEKTGFTRQGLNKHLHSIIKKII